MDSYFASVELLKYPDLKGEPVVVGGRSEHQPQQMPDGSRRYARLRDYVGRGVVTTSTYEARALGVFSGMPMMKCAKLAPDAILLAADFNLYRHYSRLFKAAVATVAPHIQNRGIDEIYIDLSHEVGETRELAQRVKNAVVEATGLSCSICVAPNRLLAKIGSDLEKPNGLTILSADDVPTRIWPLAASKINGIGPKAAEILRVLGITTVEELAAADAGLLQEHFGRSYSAWLLEAAHGIDHSEVVMHSEPKSMSRESTFETDLHPRLDRLALGEVFTNLCVRVSEDLVRKHYVGKTVGIKLRFQGFHTVTRDITLPEATNDPVLIRRAASECLKRVTLDKRIRLLGVKMSSLTKVDEAGEPRPQQADLFDFS
ncbi:DNA polymerase Y family protein [Noviherbaspirillum sp. Root189]|uniref:DNA polymerase Y family protein n=1 Tax=Noviherbaspirillum sp. Root189 TaxID=1736487 RepID=UPI0007111119|nr:DNA polymerase IV [Noviherbaspirillum sp. Root189]KRB82185.1 DNA polymerase IV [Noviherbaspirillum sp. Root189]